MKKKKAIVILICMLALSIAGVFGYNKYVEYREEQIKQETISSNKTLAQGLLDEFEKAEGHEERVEVLSKTISTKNEYTENNEKQYNEVTDCYDSYIEQMRECFISEYTAGIEENTIPDEEIAECSDKEKLNTLQSGLDEVAKIIEEDKDVVFTTDVDENALIERIEEQGKKYTDRVAAIEEEERRKAEEEAARKAEEERKAQEAAAAQQQQQYYNNNYSNGGGNSGNNYNGGNSGYYKDGTPYTNLLALSSKLCK